MTDRNTIEDGKARLKDIATEIYDKTPEDIKKGEEYKAFRELVQGYGIKYSKEYIFVRMVIDNRTQKLENYDILYAIKKEDVSPRLPDYPANRGSATSSTISISDLLENVKNVKLVNSVLSKDVCEKLGIYFVRLIFCNSEFLKQK